MKSYIENKKILYSSILQFLENSDDEHNKKLLQNIKNIFEFQKIDEDREEILQFLEIIKSIGEHHHRDQYFNEQINQILIHFKTQIKQTLSNIEIFHIFELNKKIVLFLLKNDFITISEQIYREMLIKNQTNGILYWGFFYPEIENFIGKRKMEVYKEELLKYDSNFFDNYEEKRQEGENDSYICSLIRQDSVEEFISYMTRYTISPSSQITSSIFETNSYLNDNENTTLIEYSAFFGSIQIFRYLLMNNAKLTSSLWLYTIHSSNAELIHLLEQNEISPPKYTNNNEKKNLTINYVQCLIESIKCHHNNIVDYVRDNLLVQNKEEEEVIVSNYIKYHNYSQFQIDNVIEHGFFYLCLYHYNKLFELLLKDESKCSPITQNFIQSITISKKGNALNNGSSLTQVIIPSSVISIENDAFEYCKSLAQVIIPSSVTSIGNGAFSYCKSLAQVIIPSSVTSIGNGAFSYCKSLAQVIIPSSVISIGIGAFNYCESLAQVIIPSSVTSIGDSAFRKCSSLTQVIIPSSVISIGIGAFSYCKSLAQVIIPSSVTSIEYSAFRDCSSLTHVNISSPKILIGSYAFIRCYSLIQITINSNFISIGQYAFKNCRSLKRITIQSSVVSIEAHAFGDCHSLTNVSIISSVNSIGKDALKECSSLIDISKYNFIIGDCAFANCSELKHVTITSYVTSIGNSVFSCCYRLTQITLPSTLTSIGKYAFRSCYDLKQLSIPLSVNKIGKDAFCVYNFEQITIPILLIYKYNISTHKKNVKIIKYPYL